MKMCVKNIKSFFEIEYTCIITINTFENLHYKLSFTTATIYEKCLIRPKNGMYKNLLYSKISSKGGQWICRTCI